MDVGCCPSLPSNGLDADELRPNVHIAVYTTPLARRSALCSLDVQFINIGIPSFGLSCIGQDHRSCQAFSVRYRLVRRSISSGYLAPCTVICDAAASISCKSSAVSSTDAAPMFSSKRCNFVVPGIGTIDGLCAS